MRTYFAVYLGAAALTMLATPLVARLARRLHALDVPGVRRVHHLPTPRLGGLSLVVAALTMIALVSMLDNVIGQAFREARSRLAVLLGASLLVMLSGVIDDIRGLRAQAKLLVQIVAAGAVCAFGIRIGSVTVAGLTLHFGWLSWPVTILWIVGVTNAINLIDGLDGLAAGISAIACGAIAVLALHSHQPIMAVVMLALSGSLAGFLYSNLFPARIFLGDSGALFLGFTIGAGSVMCATKSATLVGIALPALALGVPILDTMLSVVRRILERRSIFSPDRDHIHHRLLAAGFRHSWIVAFMCAATLVITGLGTFMFIARGVIPLLIFCSIVALLMVVFCVAGSVRFRQCVVQVRRNLALSREARRQRRRYEEAALYFHDGANFDAWWKSVCVAAEQMDFAKLQVRRQLRGNNAPTRVWQHPQAWMADDQMVHVVVPVQPEQHPQGPIEIECDVPVCGSLEMTGRRMMLFSRLIERHNPTNLPSDTPGLKAPSPRPHDGNQHRACDSAAEADPVGAAHP